MSVATTQWQACRSTNDFDAVFPGFKRTEVGVIPSDWGMGTLGENTDCLDSCRVPINEAHRARMSGPYPYCGANGILDYLNDYRLDDSVILIAEDGGHFSEYKTRPIAYQMSGKIWVNNHAHILKARHGVSQDFVFYSLVHKDILPYLAGGTRAKLNRGELNKIPLALPPTETEQRTIAEALSDVDGLLRALEALIAKKRAIKQAAMQQLLTGKTRLPGFSGKWSEKPLSELATVTMGQSPPSKFYNLRGDGLPLIQGNADIEHRRTVDRVWTTQASKRCNAGDLLLTVRAPVGAIGIATKDACLGRGVCGLKPVGDIAFLFQALVDAEARWTILEQGSTFTSANSKHVGQFRISVPEDEYEQTAIAAALSDMDAEITTLEWRRDKTRAIKQGMMQSLLNGRVRLVKPAQAEAGA